MPPVESKTIKEPWDVDRRLSELGLKRQPLLNVVATAVSAGADATPFHPANAAGTLSYQHGTWALRSENLADGWEIDRSAGVEAIRKGIVRVVYTNVDIACDDEQKPQPRSRKGSGSERVCNGSLFDHLPEYAPQADEKVETYFLMVDDTGAAELTRPIIKAGRFSAYVERIYLSEGGDGLEIGDFGRDDAADGFNPQVVRK